MNKDNFFKCCIELKEYLEKEAKDKKHFQEFLDEWKRVDNRNLF